MERIIRFAFVMFLISGVIISSCKKEEKSGSGQVEFTLTIPDAVQSSLKSASVSPSSVVITITDAGGNIVKNAEKLELYNMSGSYITQPLSLVSGDYKLTGFLVLDNDNNVLYASPVQGSDKAYLVQNPLPLGFSTQKDNVTKLIPQVLTASEGTPESFGYSTFSFSATETFDFLIATFAYNENLKNYELTSADITVYADSVPVYNSQLSTLTNSTNIAVYDSIGVTHKITLPESYTQYTLVITKPGYKTYSKTFTKDELKLHYRSIDKGPVMVMLEVEQQEFYMRGYFGGEYLNFSTIQTPDQCVYYTHYAKDSIAKSLEIIAYEDATPSSRSIGLYITGNTNYTDVDSFDLDKMVVPYTFTTPTVHVINILELVTERSCVTCPDDDVDYYYGFSRGDFNLTIIIESKTNDVLVGKFSGDLVNPKTGDRMTVKNGEFRCKIQRKILDYNQQ